MQKLLLFLLACYRKIKKNLMKKGYIKGNACRFYPTCSQYCFQAVQKYGSIKGLFICFKRIVRCHPWNKGGVDKLA